MLTAAILKTAQKANNMINNGDMPYLLRKNGMWYAHNNCGYTARAELAEIYTKQAAESHAKQCEEVSAIPLNEVIKSACNIEPYLERLKTMHSALKSLEK